MTFRPDTCWKDMTRNSQFSRFIAVFMSYCPQFYGSRAIYSNPNTRYIIESYDQKLIVFMSYCPEFYGSREIYSNPKTRYIFESYDQKLIVFMFMAIFMSFCQ